MKQRIESSSDDIWQQERDNWSRQKEELKAWALSQGADNSPKVIKIKTSAPIFIFTPLIKAL